MKLYVTDEDRDINLDESTMSIAMFNAIENQPFIAASRFDAVVFDLDDKIDYKVLQALQKMTIVIPRLKGEITQHGCLILRQLYEDHAAELTIAYMKNDGSIKDVISKLSEQYQWSKFY